VPLMWIGSLLSGECETMPYLLSNGVSASFSVEGLAG
jgi:hypothetical protein